MMNGVEVGTRDIEQTQSLMMVSLLMCLKLTLNSDDGRCPDGAIISGSSTGVESSLRC